MKYTGRLAGVLERVRFMEQLAAHLATGSPAALHFLDIDGIGDINDRHGHGMGDQLIMAAGQRLGAAVGPDAIVGRYAGDEFLVVDPAVGSSREASQLAERLTERLGQPFVIGGLELRAGISVGYAVSSPALVRPEDLLRAAGIALHEAKRYARGSHLGFDPEMAQRLADRMAQENDLRRAFEHRELRIYYQPQIDLASGMIAGIEALVRWHHPRRGLISASEFVPLAEQTGLIVPIGTWVLDAALAQIGAWRREIPAARRISLAINASVRQVEQPAFARTVEDAAGRHAMPLARVEIEIPESAAGRNPSELQRLHRLKTGLAIADVGSHFSVLRHLRDVPITRVKLDRRLMLEMVQEPRVQQLLEALVDLAKLLGAEVTAEGVETSAQVGLLRALGVDRAQGFYFAPPLPADEIADVLRGDRPFELPAPLVLGRASRRAIRRTGATGPLV